MGVPDFRVAGRIFATLASQDEGFRAAIFPMIRWEESFESESAGDGIFRMAEKFTVPLRNAAGLAHQQRMPVDLVEQVSAGCEKIDLVGGHQSSAREWIRLYEVYDLTIAGRIGMDREIDSLYLRTGNPEVIRPSRKNRHD